MVVAGSVALVLLALTVLSIFTDTFPDEFLRDQGRATFALLRHNGATAAVALLYLEESGVPMPVPGDAFVMFLGHHMGSGWAPAILVCLTITAAVVLGATNLYVISRRWGRRLVDGKTGRVFHLTPRRVARAERWFGRWGALALIFGRHIPGFRVPITVAAGTLRVSYRTFVLSVAVSTVTWSAFFLAVGHALGDRVGAFINVHRSATWITGATVAVVVVLYVGFRLVQLRGGELQLRQEASEETPSQRP